MEFWQGVRIKDWPVHPGGCPKVNVRGYNKPEGSVSPKTGTRRACHRLLVVAAKTRATYDRFLWTLLVIRSFGRTKPPELFDQPKLVGKACLHGRVDAWRPSITRLRAECYSDQWLLSRRPTGLFLGSTILYLPAYGTSALLSGHFFFRVDYSKTTIGHVPTALSFGNPEHGVSMSEQSMSSKQFQRGMNPSAQLPWRRAKRESVAHSIVLPRALTSVDQSPPGLWIPSEKPWRMA